MMDPAYFVGRAELLSWLNNLLQLGYTKVEQTCSAAAHCQVMDSIYPGKVPLYKVNFDARQEYEYINNFKVLQSVFDKMGIDKSIDVQKLVKGKYQDNLEFVQWMKKYHDTHFPGGPYDAVERRSQAAKEKTSKKASPATSVPKKSTDVPKTAVPIKAIINTATKTAKLPTKAPVKGSSEPRSDDQKIQDLNQQMADLKVTVDALEKERDFYFGKLRSIEIQCQSHPEKDSDIAAQVLKILYETDEESGFVNQDGGEVAEPGSAPEPVEEETF